MRLEAGKCAPYKVWDDPHSKLLSRVRWVDEEKNQYAVVSEPIRHANGQVVEDVKWAKVVIYPNCCLVVLNPTTVKDAHTAESLARIL